MPSRVTRYWESVVQPCLQWLNNTKNPHPLLKTPSILINFTEVVNSFHQSLCEHIPVGWPDRPIWNRHSIHVKRQLKARASWVSVPDRRFEFAEYCPYLPRDFGGSACKKNHSQVAALRLNISPCVSSITDTSKRPLTLGDYQGQDQGWLSFQLDLPAEHPTDKNVPARRVGWEELGGQLSVLKRIFAVVPSESIRIVNGPIPGVNFTRLDMLLWNFNVCEMNQATQWLENLRCRWLFARHAIQHLYLDHSREWEIILDSIGFGPMLSSI